MNALRRKYMEYLEKGFQSVNELRICGAAKLHDPLNSEKISRILWQKQNSNGGKDHPYNRKYRQLRHSYSKGFSVQRLLTQSSTNVMTSGYICYRRVE
jgi:hypothetical protein